MEKIDSLKKLFNYHNIDGYIIPKNDEFFSEYVPDNKDKLKFISNFSGSYGFALILKNKNYLFVDGRYALQAQIQSGKTFNIITLPYKFPANVLKKKKLRIGFDPKLHTQKNLKLLFSKTNCRLEAINENLIDRLWKKKNIRILDKVYTLPKKAVGQCYKIKINNLIKTLKKKKLIFNLFLQVKILLGF